MPSTIEFCKEYFLKSLPETTFLFLFLQLFVTNKKHDISVTISFIVSLNLLMFIIISILDTSDAIEMILVNISMLLAIFLYDNTVDIKRLFIGVVIMNFTLVLIQSIAVVLFYFAFNISLVEIDQSTFYNIMVRLSMAPIQAFILFKLSRFKNRRIQNNKNS